MGSGYEKDVCKNSPVLEVAAVPKVKLFDGIEGSALNSSVYCSSEKLIVRGEALTPLVSKNSFGQSLLIPGQDRRSRVLDTAFDPWRKICALEITAADGSALIGTGWIAGPRLIITAGHCVFNSDYNGWVDKIDVIPGRDGEQEPYGRYTATQFCSMERWTKAGDENYDIGAIILSEDINPDIGSFSFGFYPEASLTSKFVNISGYPASGAGEEQTHHANRICMVKDHKLYYDIDTEGGQSGSPIWFYPDSNDTPVVIGIHSNGAGLSLHANSGVRITPLLANKISEWRAS